MLTPQQLTIANNVLKGKLKACPVCGGKTWIAVDIVAAVAYRAGAIFVGAPSVPMLMVACKTCWYLVHFAAVPLGLVPPATTTKEG